MGAKQVGRGILRICATALRTNRANFKVFVQAKSFKRGRECCGDLVLGFHKSEAQKNITQDFEEQSAR